MDVGAVGEAEVPGVARARRPPGRAKRSITVWMRWDIGAATRPRSMTAAKWAGFGRFAPAELQPELLEEGPQLLHLVRRRPFVDAKERRQPVAFEELRGGDVGRDHALLDDPCATVARGPVPGARPGRPVRAPPGSRSCRSRSRPRSSRALRRCNVSRRATSPASAPPLRASRAHPARPVRAPRTPRDRSGGPANGLRLRRTANGAPDPRRSRSSRNRGRAGLRAAGAKHSPFEIGSGSMGMTRSGK